MVPLLEHTVHVFERHLRRVAPRWSSPASRAFAVTVCGYAIGSVPKTPKHYCLQLATALSAATKDALMIVSGNADTRTDQWAAALRRHVALMRMQTLPPAQIVMYVMRLRRGV